MKWNHKDEIGEPCRHMEPLLQRTADRSANWLVRAYAVAHAARCGRCRHFLQNLEKTLARLRATREAAAPEDAISRLERQLAAASRDAED